MVFSSVSASAIILMCVGFGSKGSCGDALGVWWIVKLLLYPNDINNLTTQVEKSKQVKTGTCNI